MKHLVFTALLASSVMLANAQNLSLDEAITQATNSSRSLKSLDYKVKSLTAKTSESKAGLLPSLKYTGSYNRLSKITPATFSIPVGTDDNGNPIIQSVALNPNILNQFTNRLAIAQPLFVGGRLQLGLEISKLNQQVASVEYDRNKADVILNTKTSYWNLYRAYQIQKQVQESVTKAQAHVNDVQELVKFGAATQNDLLASQLQLSNAKLQLIDANNNIIIATAALNNLLGTSLEQTITPTSSPRTQTVTLASLSSLTEKAISSRAEMKTAQLQEKTALLGIKNAKAGWLPQVNASAALDYNNPNQRIVPAEDKFYATWAVGINVSMDLWNWNTTKHQTEQARMQQMQAKEGIEQTKEGISLEVTQLYVSVNQALEKIKVTQESVEQAKENYRIVNEKYKKGVALNSDVIDANTALLSANVNLTATLVEYELALAKLEKAVGGLQ